jgi:hypothetical protein
MVFYARNSEPLFNSLSKEFKLVSRIQGMTFRLLIIYLYSILKESESHSLDNLLKKYLKLARKGIIVPEHMDLQNRLNTLKENRMYSIIKNLRNKHYAHLSLDRDQYKESFSIKELDDYINGVESLFKDIYAFIKPGTSVSLIGLDTKTDMFAFTALKRYIEMEEIYVKSKIENKDSIDYMEIHQILRS